MLNQVRTMALLVVLSLCVWMASTAKAEIPMLYLEDNVLAAGNYNTGWTSSDISLIIRIEAGGEIVVDEGMAVGYIVPQEDIDDWIEVDFDDSGWNGGISGVGYGDTDDNTPVRGDRIASVYTRYYFDVPNVQDIDEITVLVDYDDGYILWLNGVEIARSPNTVAISPEGEAPDWDEAVIRGIAGHGASELAAGKPNNNRWNHGGIVKHTISFDFGGQKPAGSAGKPPEGGTSGVVPIYLKDNVLAGANFNDGPGSSDMTLIMSLMGDDEIYVDEGSEVKYIHSPDNEDVEDDWIQVEFDDRGWADGISGVGFSDNDDNTVVPAGLISIWTRYHFDAPNADKIKELVLLADFDDTYLAWLNGKLIAFGGGAPAGDPPAWNATQGGCSNHGSSELPAGEPNRNRWEHSSIQRTTANFRFAGASATAVSPKSKLATTWGGIKEQN